MDRSYRFRSSIVTGLILFIVFVYVIRLFSLQLTVTEENAYGSANTTSYIEYVSGSRGQILDRHGAVLVENRATYSVTLQNFVLYNSDDPNGYLLSLAQACLKHGIEYKDSLPLTYTTPFAYNKEEKNAQEQYYFRKLMLGRGWDSDMSAENLVKLMKEVYKIDDSYTDEEVRLIMGLRYELDLVTFAMAPTLTVVPDISADQLAILKELSIPGMDVVTSSVRVYNTQYAAQLLGFVGLMDAEEYESTYKDLDYNMNAVVGKEGAERAFEEYLHGEVGEKVVTVTSDGTVVDEYWQKEPKSGNNVILAVDIGLQEAAETSLGYYIPLLAESKTAPTGEVESGWDANSGACVVMDVHTGEVLAAANYPTYDPSDRADHYDELLETEGDPLVNRALTHANAPGSTFKMITALAAMRVGVDPKSTVDGNGIYMKYAEDGYAPRCWYYTASGDTLTHGDVDMRRALSVSCNIYFYTVGEQAEYVAGKDYLSMVGESFGVGQPTGSEIYEVTGRMASPATKEELFRHKTEHWKWYAADTLMAAIGQSDTTMTPLQLCRYTAALANQGTLYNATFLRRAVSADFQTLVKEQEPVAAGTNLLDIGEWTVIRDGMYLCGNDEEEGTGSKYFLDAPYDVCAKTGTAQHGNGGSDNAAYVCWYPAENPEIAVSVYVEHGSSGGYWGQVARDVIDYYRESQNLVQEINIENTALPGGE